MNRERLSILVTFLDGLGDDKLNLCDWEKCALGLAIKRGVFDDLSLAPIFQGSKLYPSYRPNPKYPAFEAWVAVEKYFGLSSDDAIRLFAPHDIEGRKISASDAKRRVVGMI
jgi:hypothetical protein